jgi:hypothetical protein
MIGLKVRVMLIKLEYFKDKIHNVCNGRILQKCYLRAHLNYGAPKVTFFPRNLIRFLRNNNSYLRNNYSFLRNINS